MPSKPLPSSQRPWMGLRLLLLMGLMLSLPQTATALTCTDPEDQGPATQRMTSVVPGAQSSATNPMRFTTDAPARTDEAASASQATDLLDDYDTAPLQAIADPLEPWNRFWFHFNDIFYLYVARPVYNGYTVVMPEEFQSGLSNFFSNLLFPKRFLNALLQGKVQAAGVEFGRFLVNTTVGFGGFIDAAKGRKAVVAVDPSGEDLGQTFGMWGIGTGFYMVWPFLGPSNVRDSIGMVGDWALEPTFYLQPWYASWGSAVGFRFNNLGDVLPTYENIKDVAVDPYIAMREAYSHYRLQQIAR